MSDRHALGDHEWMTPKNNVENFIVDNQILSAQRELAKGNRYRAKRALEEIRPDIAAWRGRHNATTGQTITASPMYFTGNHFDVDGDRYAEMQMSDGTLRGCPEFAFDELAAEMEEYNSTRSVDYSKTTLTEIIVYSVIGIVLLAITALVVYSANYGVLSGGA